MLALAYHHNGISLACSAVQPFFYLFICLLGQSCSFYHIITSYLAEYILCVSLNLLKEDFLLFLFVEIYILCILYMESDAVFDPNTAG